MFQSYQRSYTWETISPVPFFLGEVVQAALLRVLVKASKIMNEELVCNSQHMLAAAVFYYTLSNMRNLGLAIWQACKLHIQL